MILIIDFGSQYNQLIARRVRENQVYCQIEPPDISITAIKALRPEGIILSGGPASIYDKGAPRADERIFELGVPVLGICYGLQYWWMRWAGRSSGHPNANTVLPNWSSRKRRASFRMFPAEPLAG